MKFIMSVIVIVLASMPALAQDSPLYLQFKYSPLGTINADDSTFEYFGDDYQEYDMNFDRTLGAKLIFDPVYIAVQQNITNLNNSKPDVTLETISMGLAGFNYERFAYEDPNLYLMGGLGLGAGQFKFEDAEDNKWETFLEANAEVGFRLQEHFLLGMGIDYQRFGDFGDHKANYWSLYLGTGIIF